MRRSVDTGRRFCYNTAMSYIVLDMEWNQYHSAGKCPKNARGMLLRDEIIQIGAVKLGDDMSVSEQFNTLIKIGKKRVLNEHVARVVSIDRSELDKSGVSFEEAIVRFRAFAGPDPVLLIWGYDDIPVLRQNLEFYGMPYEWTDNWYNLQLIYAAEVLGSKRQVSLQGALESFGIEPDEPLHNAFHDAKYTALICAKLDMDKGMSLYVRPVPKEKKQGRVVRAGRGGVRRQTKAQAEAVSEKEGRE